jgi:hypothetical protein
MTLQLKKLGFWLCVHRKEIKQKMCSYSDIWKENRNKCIFGKEMKQKMCSYSDMWKENRKKNMFLEKKSSKIVFL